MTETTLVLGGTGKTGRRVAERLVRRGMPVRLGSRSTNPRFDWDEPATWAPLVRDASAIYLTYYPDLAFPKAAETIGAFAELAVHDGVRRIVLLSGRGEEEAVRSEQRVQDAGAEWTVVRCSWFAQNFSEHFLLEPVLSGEIALPAGDIAEPFVDADDIADVVVAALTELGHAGRVYELTGPRLLTFADAARELTQVTGREVRYVPVTPEEYTSAALRAGVPPDEVAGLTELFTRVLDGRNAHLSSDIQRVLGRPATDFAEYARSAASTGVWSSR